MLDVARCLLFALELAFTQCLLSFNVSVFLVVQIYTQPSQAQTPPASLFLSLSLSLELSRPLSAALSFVFPFVPIRPPSTLIPIPDAQVFFVSLPVIKLFIVLIFQLSGVFFPAYSAYSVLANSVDWLYAVL